MKGTFVAAGKQLEISPEEGCLGFFVDAPIMTWNNLSKEIAEIREKMNRY